MEKQMTITSTLVISSKEELMYIAQAILNAVHHFRSEFIKNDSEGNSVNGTAHKITMIGLVTSQYLANDFFNFILNNSYNPFELFKGLSSMYGVQVPIPVNRDLTGHKVDFEDDVIVWTRISQLELLNIAFDLLPQ